MYLNYNNRVVTLTMEFLQKIKTSDRKPLEAILANHSRMQFITNEKTLRK